MAHPCNADREEWVLPARTRAVGAGPADAANPPRRGQPSRRRHLGRLLERHLLDDFQVVALQADDLLGVVGEQTQAMEPEISEDLRADAELAEATAVLAGPALVIVPSMGTLEPRRGWHLALE